MLDYQGEKFKEFIRRVKENYRTYGFDRRPTNEVLSEMLGVTPMQLTRYYKSAEIQRQTVNRIVSVFGVSEEEVFGSNGFINDTRPKNNIYFVPIKAYGGFLNGYESEIYLNQLETGYMPMLKGRFFAFEIENFSMAPKYNPGEWVLSSPVESFTDLVKGRVYVFQTIDGLILKCFDRIEGDNVYLYSLNDEYNPVNPIHKKNIKVVYQKEFILTKN